MVNEKELGDIANVLRRDVAQMTSAAGSGHPSSCFSCAEIISTLFFHEMKYDVKNSDNPDNDAFILSKGHAAPIYYAALKRAGCIKDDLNGLRKIWSNLEGHPMPRGLPWVKVATGSLGQGLSVGIGMALAAKIKERKFMTYVLMGDSEMAEGSVYEALQLAPHYQLNNLCAIIDVNRLGQRGQTIVGHDVKKYEREIEAFGWNVLSVDGHNVRELMRAFEKARSSDKPMAIVARTMKGKSVSFMEDKEKWHGKAMNAEELKLALKEIPNVKMPSVKIEKPSKVNVLEKKKGNMKFGSYELGEMVATRTAYGKALANLAESDDTVLAVDAEVSNSTKSEEVKKVRPNQFVETFIAEQNLAGICLGLSVKGFKVFGSTFAAFFTRAHDQIRMSALSNANFTLCGSHSGVSIGEDGASQMGLDDIAMFRGFPGSIIFYPSDAVSTEKLTYLASKTNGLKYIRTTRDATPVLYSHSEKFKVGNFKILRSGARDRVVLVGAGVTLHECLKAHELLKKKKIESAVVDLYCVKPFNSLTFVKFVKKHSGRIVVAEDHFAEGGIGEMLASELENSNVKISHLAVRAIPHSGKAAELLKKYRIDAWTIVKEARKLIED